MNKINEAVSAVMHGNRALLHSVKTTAILLRYAGEPDFYYGDAYNHSYLCEFSGKSINSGLIIAIKDVNDGPDFAFKGSIYEKNLAIECSGEMVTFNYDEKEHKIIESLSGKSFRAVRLKSEQVQVKQLTLPKEILLLNPMTIITLA